MNSIHTNQPPQLFTGFSPVLQNCSDRVPEDSVCFTPTLEGWQNLRVKRHRALHAGPLHFSQEVFNAGRWILDAAIIQFFWQQPRHLAWVCFHYGCLSDGVEHQKCCSTVAFKVTAKRRRHLISRDCLTEGTCWERFGNMLGFDARLKSENTEINSQVERVKYTQTQIWHFQLAICYLPNRGSLGRLESIPAVAWNTYTYIDTHTHTHSALDRHKEDTWTVMQLIIAHLTYLDKMSEMSNCEL